MRATEFNYKPYPLSDDKAGILAKYQYQEEVMKNKFKILFLSFILLTSCSNGRTKSYENNFRKYQYGNDIFIEAKMDAYRNLNDV